MPDPGSQTPDAILQVRVCSLGYIPHRLPIRHSTFEIRHSKFDTAMTVLLLGGTGFIGSRVVRRMHTAGHDITVFHRGETTPDLPAGVRTIHGDRNDLGAYADRLRRAAPDVVIDVIPYIEAHAQGVVDVFAQTGARILALSSSDVYRNYDGWRGASTHAPDPVPLDENAPLRASLYPYRGYDLDFAYTDDYDKIVVERTFRDADLPTTILRLPAVYGPGNDQHRFGRDLQRMDDGRAAIVLGKQHAQWRWTHGFVENVAAAIVAAAETEDTLNATFNMGEQTALTTAKRIRAIGDLAGWTGEVVTVPDDQLPDPLQIPGDWRYELATDPRRFYAATGFEPPVSLDDALRETIAAERKAGLDADLSALYTAEDNLLRDRG